MLFCVVYYSILIKTHLFSGFVVVNCLGTSTLVVFLSKKSTLAYVQMFLRRRYFGRIFTASIQPQPLPPQRHVSQPPPYYVPKNVLPHLQRPPEEGSEVTVPHQDHNQLPFHHSNPSSSIVMVQPTERKEDLDDHFKLPKSARKELASEPEAKLSQDCGLAEDTAPNSRPNSRTSNGPCIININDIVVEDIE
jgi:hypothetical protein